MFELVPVINSIRDKHIPADAISSSTLKLLKKYFRDYLEAVLGLKSENQSDSGKLDGVLELLIELRKEARTRKDYATSDKIRNQLGNLGIHLKDEKDGSVSYTF